MAVIALVALVGSGCAWITRVSVGSAGTEANDDSFSPVISADGRFITFWSEASNLVAHDTNARGDVFVQDVATGATTRVSVDSTGAEANSISDTPAISADGRYVTFNSLASNLVAGDTNGVQDVFVHDVVTGATTRVSVDSTGTEGSGKSLSQAISADGRYIAFRSFASNLVAGDTNNDQDVFVRDTVTATTTRASVDSTGTESNGSSDSPAISADGRYIIFRSDASNLVAGDTNSARDVFVRDTLTGTTSRVSVDSAGTGGSDHSDSPAISADGRYIAFRSSASNLIAGDINAVDDVFVHDTGTGTTIRVSVDSAGSQANGSSGNPGISSDGRFVTFSSLAPDLVTGDTNGATDVFVRDTLVGTTSRMSVDIIGTEGNGSSITPAISADGRYVTFSSGASNLIGGDTNVLRDVFVRANPQPTVTAVVPTALPRGVTTPITVTGTNFDADVFLGFIGDGITFANWTVVSPTEITADVTVDAGATVGTRDVSVGFTGTGPRTGLLVGAWGLCADCFTVT